MTPKLTSIVIIAALLVLGSILGTLFIQTQFSTAPANSSTRSAAAGSAADVRSNLTIQVTDVPSVPANVSAIHVYYSPIKAERIDNVTGARTWITIVGGGQIDFMQTA